MNLDLFLNHSSKKLLFPAKQNESTFLITGGTGIVGLHLIALLIHRGIPPKKISGTFYRELPLYLPEVLRSINWIPYDQCFDLRVENIIHAATYAQPIKYTAEATQTCKLNSTDIFRLFEFTLKRPGRFLYVSSSDVYKGCDFLPYSENQLGLADPWNIRACYTESKRFGETICSLHDTDDISVRVARLALGYGAGNKFDDRRVLYEFVSSALRDGKILMADDGRLMRTYISMADAARMMLNIMFHGRERIYNVGGVSRLSIRHLGELIANLTSATLIVGPPTPASQALQAAPEDVWLDNKRYVSEFESDFEDLSAGLEKTIEWNRALILAVRG